MKLLQRFILYTFIIICISIFIGLFFSNALYIAFVKEQMNNRYLAIAEQLAEQMEEYEITLQASSDFLQTMSDLGYQIALVREDGKIIMYGEPFQNNEFNDQMHGII